ncbi:MAG: hypothetical protein COW29_02110 [Rhodobacterales bacterium CG15_BIG_FIL_POST_REV_8_21_14_020_59_13]|nr:MAG: hypothetical protein COW29_02110 [Rhodobacterales bacterium CG15_BIG_FIL_POST_REV_8_21_14_020_59_13]
MGHSGKLLALSASILALQAMITTPARADPSFILDARLRYEAVDQDGFADTAQALTLRTRFGLDSGPVNGFRFLIEGENVLHLVDDFNSTTNGNSTFPVIADPEDTGLNRAQIAYSGLEDTTLTLGRQRVILGDARYIGNVGFRQNEQTFDAFRVTYQGLENLTINYLYLDRVNRIFGNDHPAGDWDLDGHVLTADFQAPAGQLSGFAYLIDNQDAIAQSSATYGLRWQGEAGHDTGPAFSYFVEYAYQTEYGDNPVSFDLGLFRAQARLAQNGYSAAIGLEDLEGDGVRGFGTPLATLHAFQGWADVFLATPPDGIRDFYVQGGWTAPDAFFGQPLSLSAIYHDFESGGGGGGLGSEFDLVATSRLTEHLSLQFKSAFYDGPSGGPADRNKFWFAITVSR